MMKIKIVCNGKCYCELDCVSDSRNGVFLHPLFGEYLNKVFLDYRASEKVLVVLSCKRSVSDGDIAFDFAIDDVSFSLGSASLQNDLVLFEFTYGLKMIEKLYDLLVYVTCNYSQMPEEFKARFSEGECVKLRQSVYNFIAH